MNIDTALYWVQEMLTTVVVLCAPVMIAAVSVGLGIAIFQAATSIQEMTLTFVPKILAVGAVLLTFGSWMLQSLVEYARQLILSIPNLF